MRTTGRQFPSHEVGHLAALVASSEDAIISTSLEATILTWNQAATRIYGCPADEAIGQPLAMLLPPDRAGEDQHILKRLRAGQSIDPFETVCQRKDGSRLNVSLTISPIRDQHGKLGGVSIIARDVTQQKTLEQRLHERDALMQAIIDHAVDGIITIDHAGTIKSFNPAAERIFAYSRAQVLGRNVKILMSQPYRAQHDAYLQQYLHTREPQVIGIGRQVMGRRQDGTTFPMELAVSEVHVADKRLFAGIVRDISERKWFEKQIADLSATEQRRIGQELHDSLGQQVSAIGMLAKSLQKRLSAKHDQPMDVEAQRAASLVDAVQQAETQLRALSRGLLPVEVDRRGLMAALDQLTQSSALRYDKKCEFVCLQPVMLDDNFTATQLYRIAQEAIHNAAKHAQCQSITVRLEKDGPALRLCIQDDGVGINVKQSHASTGLGMYIMRYRADLIDAMLNVRPLKTGGTQVICMLGKPPTEP